MIKEKPTAMAFIEDYLPDPALSVLHKPLHESFTQAYELELLLSLLSMEETELKWW